MEIAGNCKKRNVSHVKEEGNNRIVENGNQKSNKKNYLFTLFTKRTLIKPKKCEKKKNYF